MRDGVGGGLGGTGEASVLVCERKMRAVGCCCRVVRCSYKEWMYGLNLGWVDEW